MNKNSWKMRCVDGGNSNWEVGNIIVVKDNKGTNDEYEVGGDFSSFEDWCEERKRLGSKWELVEDSFTKSDLQEGDIVIAKNGDRRVYFGGCFIAPTKGDREIYTYYDDLKRKCFNGDAIMQIYRNGQLIFNREEQSQRDIKIKELQDKMDAIKREMEELK